MGKGRVLSCCYCCLCLPVLIITALLFLVWMTQERDARKNPPNDRISNSSSLYKTLWWNSSRRMSRYCWSLPPLFFWRARSVSISKWKSFASSEQPVFHHSKGEFELWVPALIYLCNTHLSWDEVKTALLMTWSRHGLVFKQLVAMHQPTPSPTLPLQYLPISLWALCPMSPHVI